MDYQGSSTISKIIKNSAAAAAAKSLQSCLTLCNPIDGSPPGSPIPRILQARVLEWVAIAFSRLKTESPSIKNVHCPNSIEAKLFQKRQFYEQNVQLAVP